ncbi:ATP-binding SpoIIE family protein phosphatase [Streptomyces palmae]|nr:SpoIIE family protein phosphatase [Streptomyces palmae]
MRSALGGDDYPFAVYNTGAAVVDAAGTVVAWTSAAEECLGHRAEEVCGRPVAELLAGPIHRDETLGRRTDRIWDGRAPLRHREGGVVELGFRVVPLQEGTDAQPGTPPGDAPAADGDAPEPGGPSPWPGRHGGRYLVLCAPYELVTRWRQEHALAGELFEQNRIGLALFDAELRLMRTNTPLLPYTGVPDRLAGHRLGDFLWAQDVTAAEELLRRVLETGEPVVNFTTRVRTVDDPRSGAMLRIMAFPLQEPSGRLLGVAALYQDVTEEHRSRERIAVLHRATAVLGGSLSAQQTGEDLAAALAPALADTVAVDVAEPVFTGGEPVPHRLERTALRRTAVTGEGGDALRANLVPLLSDLRDGPHSPPTTGLGTLVTGLDLVAVGDPPPEWAIAVPGVRSAMSVPLITRDTVMGNVTLWRTAAGRPAFDGHDLELVQEIASRAALALDNVRRYTREHLAAVSLQRSLLPPAISDTAAVRTASVYLPADPVGGVSGDWYDVIPLSSARVALVVGDVVGHGLPATAAMARLRTAVRTLADLDPDPDELLAHLDDLVHQLAMTGEPGEHTGQTEAADDARPLELSAWGREHGPAPGDADGSYAATCLYAVYDPVNGRCSLASAGHPPPALLDVDGSVRYLDMSPGPPLGVGGLPFEKTVMELPPGSVLALYTDGLLERGAGDVDEGMERLRKRLMQSGALNRPLHDAAREIVAALPPARLPDDVTLLVAGVRRLPAGDTVWWALTADPAVVAQARELVSTQLTEWGLEALVFTTELVVSELVTNAIRYAGGPVQLRLIRTDVLTCEVSDPSSSQPRMRRARVTEEGGRGLYLVAQLSTRWGSRYTRAGKTIWAEQALPPAV